MHMPTHLPNSQLKRTNMLSTDSGSRFSGINPFNLFPESADSAYPNDPIKTQ